jgi:enediyne biosynthesis protein E4
MLLAAGCAPRSNPRTSAGTIPPPASRSSVTFTDVTQAAGIHFKHTSGRSGRLYFPETVGSGCAFLDYNNDGKLDLFLVNSSRLPGYRGQGPLYSALYRNNGNGTFTDVTKAAGLAVDCYGMGVAVADDDGDGFEDLYLTALGPNHLFHNNGDGTFTDVTRKAGVGDSHFSTSAAWLDYDRDGKLDLFVCNYCQWTPQTNQLCPDPLGRMHMCSPAYYKGEPSTLYRNNGDGTFTDVTAKAGLRETAGKALGVTVWDYNGDGWLDFAVARDKEPNSLYRNNKDGTFTDVGVETGIAYSMNGTARSGMGIDTGDITNSGRESILIGNLDSEGHALFTPDPSGRYTDSADSAGLLKPSLPMSTFATLFLDYDGDGLKDCFTANGHVDETVERSGRKVTFEENLLAFHNEGAGKFASVGDSLGAIFQEKRLWRGLAAGDFDNDGDLDLLVSTCNGRPALLRNEGGNRNHWLQVKAIAAGRNRDGIGTRVTVTAGGTRQIGWIRTGSSYCSQSELTAYFGLGRAPQAETVELFFPSGARQTLNGVRADQLIVVKEAHGGSSPERARH